METREQEVWKPIPNYEGLYEVSSWGKIRTIKRYRKCNYGSKALVRQKILKPFISRNYLNVILTCETKRKTIRLHRLIFKVFNDTTDRNHAELKDINHRDLNKLNNYYKNLEEVSKSENQIHRYLKQETSSIYPGVTFRKNGKRQKRYIAQFQFNGIKKYVGSFLTEIEAYESYLIALKENGIINKYATQSQ